MIKKDLLKIIKENNYQKFNDFMMSGADFNQTIFGKSLLHHALLYNSNQCLNLLLLYGADPKELRHIDNWKERLASNDTAFVDMVSEIETPTEQGDMVAQITLNFMSQDYMPGNILSYRNVVSFSDPEKYYKKVSVGLHIFEYRNREFVEETIPTLLFCDFDFKNMDLALPDKKYVMIVSLSKVGNLRAEIPGIPQRIKQFMNFVEVPISEMDQTIKDLEDQNEFVVGVRCSDGPCIMEDNDGVVDLNFRDPNFNKKENTELISDLKTEPVFFSINYTFNNLIAWDHQIDSWVREFKARYGVFPNILLASSATYSRIDMVVNARGKDHLRGAEGQAAPEEEFVSMSGFKGEGYEVDFCIEEELGGDTVRLIYDSDPDGGEEVPDAGDLYLDGVG